MSNMCEMMQQEERDTVVNTFANKLIASGYSREQARIIITSGLKGYENRRRRELEGGTPVHRTKHSTQKGRDLRMLIQKNSWFKSRQTQAPGAELNHGTQGWGGSGDGRPSTKHKNPRVEPVTVLFVPRTPEGRLIQTLRGIELNLSQVNT